MRITRIYTGTDGESHFEDKDVPLTGRTKSDRRSELQKAAGIIFRETGGEYDLNWHNAPRRQYIINLSGQVEIEIGDGTKRRFGPGDILLAEDTKGKGHISRAVNNQPRTCIFVTLES